jgi:hypothetical protein
LCDLGLKGKAHEVIEQEISSKLGNFRVHSARSNQFISPSAQPQIGRVGIAQ